MHDTDITTPVQPELSEPRRRMSPPRRAAISAAIGIALVIAGFAVAGLLGFVVGLGGCYLLMAGARRAYEIRSGRPVDLGLIVSAGWLVVLSAAAVLASVLPLAEGRDPANTLTETAKLPPDLFSRHPFGTDGQALDIFAQLLFGARVSLFVATGAVLIALVVGGAAGVLAGYFHGKIEAVVGFVTDVMLSFPALILLLALASVFKPTVMTVTIALGVLGIPGTVRLARASTLAIASREFVVASRTLGARTVRVILREVVPNVVPPLVAYSFVAVGFLIVAEASLSFLGLGIQRPNPTWGNLIAQGQSELATSAWLVVLPSIFLFLTVLSSNYIGQRLQQKWAL